MASRRSWRRTGGSDAREQPLRLPAELAAAEKIHRSYRCRVLRLTLLAPEIVEAIMDGRQPEEVTLPALMKGFPVEWERHRSGL